jgi:putative protease
MNKNIELLAPAGNLEKVKWAIMYGADAVYFGGKNYGLRANANNLSIKEIKEACHFVHSYNKKVYVTVNIVFHNEDLEGLTKYLIELDKCKVDAIIISDPFIIDIVKQNKLNFEIHLSTQQNTLNYEACKYFEAEGITRIVLAREVSKKDIIDIKKHSNIELETFIHGAMCVGYSGRCVLSNYFTLRDSNRGGCSQICRWNFSLYDKSKHLISNKDFSIAVKDLSMAKHIPELINIGVKSFKIEGRMRSIYYIATVIHIYRKIIDDYLNKKITYNEEYEYELYRCANREAIPQYFTKKPGVEGQYYLGREEMSNKDFLGIVLEYDDKRKEIILEQRNYFKVNDDITLFGPNTDTFNLKVEYIKDEKLNSLDAARHPKQIVRIPCNKKVNKNDIIRIKFVIDNK